MKDECVCSHKKIRHTAFSGCLGNSTPTSSSDCECQFFNPIKKRVNPFNRYPQGKATSQIMPAYPKEK